MLFYSLISGIIAWAIPIALRNKVKKAYLVLISFISCGLAVLCELIDIMNRIHSNDIAGIEDTIGIVIFGLMVMILVAGIINAAVLSQEQFQ